jgi:AcrR family transcriptional regulator
MARPQQVADDTILAAARRVFLEHGPSASTARIAAEVGISQAAVFKRFHNKANLMVAALAPPSRPAWLGLVEGGPDARPIEAQLTEIGLAALAFFRGLVPCLMVLKSAGIDPQELLARFDDPPPLRVRRALAAWLSAARDQGRLRCGDPLDLAQHFIGALHVRAFLGHVFTDAAPIAEDPRYVDHLVSTLWHGIAPAVEAR